MPDLRQGCATGAREEDTAPDDAALGNIRRPVIDVRIENRASRNQYPAA